MARLLVDQMCGTLAQHLRFCGHDTIYAPDVGLETDADIAAAARAQDRIVITRDRALGHAAQRAILLDALDIEGQLAAVAAAGVSLELPAEPTRCGRCNGELTRGESPPTADYVPDDLEVPTFVCPDCDQVFWRGSHWSRVESTIERALER